ncbi:MAG: glycosyltransferase family 2 protein [Candidatus Omnitrophica bacterium]|nr:glycosyltransferase family 2 protein [Candidatus Omnitrophota bacterium]
MGQVPITVVIITKNEEQRIEECLKSVHSWADEIIIVDDESTDGTQKIAQKYIDKFLVRKMEVEGTHRNWAYAQAKNNWILSLDADERLTQELRDEIDGVLPTADCEVYSIPRRNYIGDYWMKWGGQYPSGQDRLFQKGKFIYRDDEVHPGVKVKGKGGRLTKDMIHYSYRDFSHFLSKLNGQSTLEAKKWIRDGRKVTMGKAMWRAFDRFFRTYLRKKGHKDGFIGFMMAFFASLYQIMSYAKYWEMKKNIQSK